MIKSTGHGNSQTPPCKPLAAMTPRESEVFFTTTIVSGYLACVLQKRVIELQLRSASSGGSAPMSESDDGLESALREEG